jgi:hypothetical protein
MAGLAYKRQPVMCDILGRVQDKDNLITSLTGTMTQAAKRKGNRGYDVNPLVPNAGRIFVRTSDEMCIICEKIVSGPLVGRIDIR